MASPGRRTPRLPPIQTVMSRPPTAQAPATPVSTVQESTNYHNSPSPDSGAAQDRGRQRFVLADYIAFRYLEQDSTTRVVERRAELRGYQCYVVEQWATSRSHPTFTITTYTGDPSHTVVVGVLSVPTDESAWSARLRVYFKALNQSHAKRRETPLGILMVTTLAGFPSSLTVISVPTGDLRKHRADFIVNENLKRMGCSGRVGLNLSPPSGATVAKFQQLYHTSDKNDVYKAVTGLVKLCQSALTVFDKLEADYADGLLCDVTERAINDWWRDIGSYFYHVEPHDGILGPTTVSGLLGLLLGARNRLHSVSAPVSKDALDIESMKRGIGVFQKQQRLNRTRRLDRRTLEKLHQLTQKHAEHGGWGVPKAVKSTVAELSGKGGEMVMDAVGRRDRAGIAEVETCDMERFVQLAFGEQPRWLWYGKPLKKSKDHILGHLSADEEDEAVAKSMQFREGEQGGYTWAVRKSATDDVAPPHKGQADDPRTMSADEDLHGEKPRHRTLIKRPTGMKDNKLGMDRLKGAVRLGGRGDQRHQQTSSRDEHIPSSPQTPGSDDNERRRRPLLARAQTSPSHHYHSPNSSTTEDRPDTAVSPPRDPLSRFRFPSTIDERSAPPYTTTWQNRSEAVNSSRPPSYIAVDKSSHEAGHGAHGMDQPQAELQNGNLGKKASVVSSVVNEDDKNEPPPASAERKQDPNQLLRRTLSFSQFITTKVQSHSDDAYARHLSFSLAEESVLSWSPVTEETTYNPKGPVFNNTSVNFADQEFLAQEAKSFRHILNTLSTNVAPWTESQLSTLQTLLERAEQCQSQIEEMYHPRADAVQSMSASSGTVMRDQKQRFEEGKKEIEMLAAKLDYEIDGLRGRIEDVGAGVQDFRKGVQRVEDRVKELEKDLQKNPRRWNCTVM